MNPSLSIVMASHNDAEQTVLTLQSIRETSPPEVEVIIVDDCSATPLHHYIRPSDDGWTKLIQNRHRCGCGPSRHIGALKAKGDWLLIIDSHNRFKVDWYEEWSKVPFVGQPNTAWCATCCGLDTNHMDVNHPVTEYHGATLNFYGPDRYKPGNMQVFEAVWLGREQEPEDLQEIPAIMGACYFMSREWFLHLAPTRFLRTWGCDEQMISLKTWFSGGTVRMAKNVKIGHKFLLDGKEKQKFGVPVGHVIFNKLLGIHTLLPSDVAVKLTTALLSGKEARDIEAAKLRFRDDYFLVAQERAYNRTIFTRDVHWLCDKFKIPLP